MSLYLDYNASAPIDEEVLNTMIDVYKNRVGNADSRTHTHGERANIVVEKARKQVASLLGVDSTEVFFTSGATESNNIAIQGLDEYANQTGKKHIITTSIEHKAVLETVKAMEHRGYTVDIVNPNVSGRVNVDEVLSRVRDDTLLVSIMHVNNETGIIQPIAEIGEALENRSVFFHVDATQSCGKLVDDLRKMKYDMLSFSAHKLRGPQGIGALILKRRKYKLPPVKHIMYGGQQEHGIRPGTIPVALVAGCGKACEIAEAQCISNAKRNRIIKDKLYYVLESSGIKYHYNGDPLYCVDSTANICFPGVSSEALMISSKQYCSVSNGSACTSKSYTPSYVLKAMSIPVNDIESSIRISWGPDTDVDEFEEAITMLIEMARKFAV